jgi:putative membrane protein
MLEGQANMEISRKAFFLAAALTAAAATTAQTPPPSTGTADPSAASTPHQRAATGNETAESPTNASPEASAASSPHQGATAMKHVSDDQLKMAHQDGAVPATFVKKAALAGMTEVELGKIALSKSQDPAIRKFAQQMVDDHTKANDKLVSIAKTKGITVPAELDAEHKAMIQAMNAKSGAAFDTAYAEAMNKDHAKAVALFEGASTSTDSDLSRFAKTTLPTLNEHKQMAHALPKMRSADAATKK